MTTPPSAFGLIADDLTGACDAGVQFAERGLRTLAWLCSEDPPREPDVLALLTEGRSLEPEAARRAARAACERLVSLGRRVLFQKIDSTFRGNPGHEIHGVMEAGGFDLAIVTPAFPAMGRTVARGWLQVSGEREPLHLASRLRQQGVTEVVEAGCEEWIELARSPHGKPTVVIVDAQSDFHLERLAALWLRTEPRPLAAGSAGLARAIAAVLTGPGKGPEISSAPSGQPGPVLLMIGSTHPATSGQIEQLRQSGAVVLGADAIPAARQALLEGHHTVVRPDPVRPRSATFLGWAETIRECRVRGLVLCGGDTALAVCRAMGVKGIELEQEILTGIPSGRLVGGSLNGLAVVTKAGGFGGPDALGKAAEFLSRCPANLE